MLEKLNEVKVLKDSLHGYVHIEYAIVWELIDTKELQRLRRIRQLGGAFQVYHSAEHSRFSHSVGVYEIIRQMLIKITDLDESLSKRDKIVVLLAGLLHDLGHNPYSHAFEGVFNTKHEVYTKNIILGPSEVNDILIKYDKDLPQEIVSVIEHTHPNPILKQLISSELDADRMDYLLRDSYMTGTKYGVFDIDRLIRTFRVKDKRLVIKYSGIHAIEDYVMSRYHMYHQVYFHPTGRSFEILLKAFFKRIKYLHEHNMLNNDIFNEYLTNDIVSNEAHYFFDENTIGYAFLVFSKHEDKIISDLASRLLSRNLFKYKDYSEELYEELTLDLAINGYDVEYYLFSDTMKQRPYQPYRKTDDKGIFVLMKDDTIKELSKASVIVKALVKAEEEGTNKIYFPNMLDENK